MRLFWRYWGTHWDMGHQVDKIREACKYPTKPGDLDNLRPALLAVYLRATKGMKLVQPLGELAEARRSRRSLALTGRRWRKEGELKLLFRPCWNAQGPHDLKAASRKAVAREMERRRGLWRFTLAATYQTAAAEIRAARSALRAARSAGITCAGLIVSGLFWGLRGFSELARRAYFAAQSLILATETAQIAKKAEGAAVFPQSLEEVAEMALSGAWPVSPAEYRLQKRQAARANRPPPKALRNRVIARLPAATYFDPIARPALLVANFGGTPADWQALRALPFVADYLAAVRAQIRAAESTIREAAEAAAEAAISGFPSEQSSHLTRNSDGVFAQ